MTRSSIPHDHASRDRMSHAYRHGMGYVYVGKLPMPVKAVHPAIKCEPVVVAADMSLHFINPPNGAAPMQMRWHVATKDWTPLHPGAGKRIGYSSEYMAAHGWHYIGPVPV